ncbi:hypothetical protein AURDEDRAFT_159223 [Auricularia subglabra TFB-10046 SS5]|nr:hypothetical protein AURDEDRAFT_159223 [Auricularia subglabra TFB-10046 SS5]
MSDAAQAPAAGKLRHTEHAVDAESDRVGEELADDARIWHVYERVAKEDDDRRITSWNRGLDNIALFAGLSSAVTTAFIIEAQKDMKPDFSQLMFLALNATANGQRFVQKPFIVPSSARAVNCLWVASLVLSLLAALIAIMGKDWIVMYSSRPVCNLRQWAEMRTYRLRCVEQWCMSGVIASAPVLLHISLLLFVAGLVVFISSDQLTHHLTLALCLAAGAVYLVTALSAIIFSTSPFKSPATQMLRLAIAAFVSYMRYDFACRPKRNLAGMLLGAINVISVPCAEDSPNLPGLFLPGCRRALGWPLPVLSALGNYFLAFVRSSPTSIRAACEGLRWSRIKRRLDSARALQMGQWFTASTWTDLPVDRRPELISGSLLWLSNASQAPDVFRTVLFALGDLDIGEQVGRVASRELQTRIRAEIRQHWRRVDFLTLSRYVLADRHLSGSPVVDYWQFIARFDVTNTPLRCEDGLAAIVKIRPNEISAFDIASYCPDRVSQPRMVDFLLPFMPPGTFWSVEPLIVLLNKYRAHVMPNVALRKRLEVKLYQCLDLDRHEGYATHILNEFGRRAGVIELLTFLCGDGDMMIVTADYLLAQLCHPRTLLDDDEKAAIIHLILEECALRQIVQTRGSRPWRSPREAGRALQSGVAILAAIVRHVGSLLRDPDVDTFEEGESLFGLLAFAGAKRPDGINVTWDLGEWLRNEAAPLLEKYPDAGTAFQDFHEAMVAIYAIRSKSSLLTADWDGICYPGRPDDTFSDPFLSLDAFFRNSESSVPRTAGSHGL